MKVAMVANISKHGVVQVANRICQWCRQRGIPVYAQRELGCGDNFFTLDQPLPEVDVVLVLGGDGTFLNVARRYSVCGVPFLGVNLGRLGFLTEVEVGDVEIALEKLVAGEYYIDRRSMLAVKVWREKGMVEQTFALNEATITKGPLSRIIRLDVSVDGARVGDYHGDGLMVSTPTGSTGYSLSAGGPIIAPNVMVMVITPICPHTLHARPIVVAHEARIVVEVKSTQPGIVLTVDGQHYVNLQCGDRLEICSSRHSTALIRLHGKGFFDILRYKLLEQNRNG